LAERFSVPLPATGQNVENTCSIAHFDGEDFLVNNDEGSSRGSDVTHSMTIRIEAPISRARLNSLSFKIKYQFKDFLEIYR
jgi:hypothetical protein